MRMIDDFSVGQKVKTVDTETGQTVFGDVVLIQGEMVYIQWDDLLEKVPHTHEEFSEIKPA